MQRNFAGSLSPLPPKMYAAPTIPQNRPVYRILAGKGVFLDDIMFFEGDIVIWDEEPNKEMEPLNDLAKEATNRFFDDREELAKAHSLSKGRKYIPGRRPIEEERGLITAEARRVELVKGDGGIPVMGARRKPGRPARAEKPIADLSRARRNAANSVRDNNLDS